MNLTETKKQRAIALDQASVSERKMNWYNNNGRPKTAEIYRIRMVALRLLAKELQAALIKQERKTFKHVNN